MKPPSTAVLLPRRSLAGWAALAVVMVVGSYLITILLALACVYLPYLLVANVTTNIQAWILLLCGVVMAATILWSLVPRRDNFVPPGPRLEAESQPRLFAELESLATALNEPMPREIYLIPDVNAWVAERGGTMGIGSRRVMGLGLPLMQMITVSQFRAVLAHEFGHYYGGDTRLGPLVYRTRAAMVRTLINLTNPSGPMRALTRIAIARLAHVLVIAGLKGYWTLFLRATQMVSRRQESRADELACSLAGSQALIDGLSAIQKASTAMTPFWQTELAPVLQAGYRPPIAAGFGHFVAAPGIAKALSEQLEAELRKTGTNSYDTHPPLRSRIAAARALPYTKPLESEAGAIALIDQLDILELQLLRARFPQLKAAELRTVQWDKVGTDVYIPIWRNFTAEYAPVLAGLTAGSLPEAVKNLAGMGARMRDPKGMLLAHEQRANRAAALLWMSLALALIDAGWELRTQPGESYLHRGEGQLSPAGVVGEMRLGKLSPDAWRVHCLAMGIAELRLDRKIGGENGQPTQPSAAAQPGAAG
jgi:Zn-dependent protease with chaperone function